MRKPIMSIVFTILMGFSFNASSTTYLSSKTNFVVLITTDTTICIHNSSFVISDSLTGGAIQKEKKLVSALFAFPFPFGFMGAHRIMLGSKPWIPVVYVATFGGCFGLLPLIDFCVITFSKDLEQYENNPHLFMWVK